MARARKDDETTLKEAEELSKPVGQGSALVVDEEDDEEIYDEEEDDDFDEEEEDDDFDDMDDEDEDDFFDDFDDGGLLRTGTKKEEAGPRESTLSLDPDIRGLNNPDVISLQNPPKIGQHGTSDIFGDTASTFGRATSPKLYASAGQWANCVQFRVWRMENGIPVAIGVIDSEATEEDFVRMFYRAMPHEGEGKFQFRCRPIDQRGAELGKEFVVNISEHHSTLMQMRDVERRKAERDNRGWGGPRGDVIVQGSNNDGLSSSMAEEMGRMFETAVERAEQQNDHLQHTLESERERLRAQEQEQAKERVNLAQRASQTTEKMMERIMQSDRARSEEAMKAQRQHSDLLMTTLTTVFQQQQESQRAQAERMREQDRIRMQQDREYFERQRQEMEDRRRQEKEEYERKRQHELEQFRIEKEREREEARLRLEREKMELEQRREEMRLERERQRQEADERWKREQLEWDRKMQQERERMANERKDWERREAVRREEMQRDQERRLEEARREENRRREELQLQMKQMEVQAQQAREHQERMTEQSRLEREAQREALERRERLEKQAREEQERERQRRYEMQVREMEMQKEKDREHQERMLQLSRIQNSGGLSGITDMLGMDTPELLGRIFGGGDEEDGGSWSDALPKILSGVADVASRVASSGPPPGMGVPPGRKPGAGGGQQIPVQTPQGVKMISVDKLRDLQQAQQNQGVPPIPVPNEQPAPPPSFHPSSQDEPAGLSTPESVEEIEDEDEDVLSEDYQAAQGVDTTKRAKEAGLSFKQIRSARRGLRTLAKKFAKSEKDEWEALVTAAIVQRPEIFEYIQSVTAYAALAETKAAPSLVEEVISELKKSELVPEGSFPYNESDLAALNAVNEQSGTDAAHTLDTQDETDED